MNVLTVYSVLVVSKVLFVRGLEPGARRELWQAIYGDQVYNMTSSYQYKYEPADLVTTLAALDAPLDIGENYGQQITSYFLAPAIGHYYFYLSCNLACQLWISTDQSPANLVLNMEIKPPGLSDNSQWQKGHTPVWLEKHHFYSIKVLMKEKNGTDFLSVGVNCPNNVSSKPIRAPYLYLEIPEQHLGSFTKASSDVIPTAQAYIHSFINVCQTTCASYCVRHVTCHSFSYHVTTKSCVLYKETTDSLVNSDVNRYLYIKVQ